VRRRTVGAQTGAFAHRAKRGSSRLRRVEVRRSESIETVDLSIEGATAMESRRSRPRRRAALLIGTIAALGGAMVAPSAAHGRPAMQASATTAAAAAVAAPRRVGPSGAVQLAATTPDVVGQWSPLLDWGLQAKHMVALPTGKVIVWSTGSTASVWDPATGSFTAAPALFGDLHCAGQSVMADGRVIVVGGQNGAPHIGTTITSIFDPYSGTWTQGPDMSSFRWYATSTTLADGRVLASSGDAPDGTRATIPEIYDPVANTWTRLTGASRSQSLYPLMFVLPDKRVFEAGPGSATAILDTTGVGSWTAGPTNAYATNGYSESAVMYAPGKIIRAGGGDPAINRVSVIDMTAASPAWRDVTPMAFPRRRMNLTILADGSVMAIGGTRSADDATQAVLESEIWNPATEQWTTVAAMAEPRMYHSSAVLLPDGRVVVGGGEAAGRLRAQLYSPPYLAQGTRPVISSAPAVTAFGTTFTVMTPDAASITSVAMIRLAAATHAFDQNQRYVPLSFSIGAGSLSVTGPIDGGIAPPGPYQLVIKNAAGVPSVASMIRVDSAGNLIPGTIRGTITDAGTGQPMAGATIALGARSTTSDATGAYVLSNVPAGEQSVTFSAPGYATVTRSQSVVAGGSYRIDVALAAPGRITGHVRDVATGLPLGGATITYPGGETTSDATGAYAIGVIAAGPETIAASASGYGSAVVSTTVPAGGSATVDFDLVASATFITGTVSDLATGQPLSGATVTGAAQTTTTDSQGRYRIDVAAGTYTVTASAAGHDPLSHDAIVSAGTYAVTDFSLAATVGLPATLSFVPVADAYVNQASPSKNYGGTTIRVRTAASGGTYVSFLRFVVSGLAGRSVSAAKLRLYDTDKSVDGGRVVGVGSAWTETGINWSNAPATNGPTLGSAGAVTANTWVSIGLTPSSVPSDGTYSFALLSGSSDSAYYMSRSGANPPVLELTTSGGPPPPPPPTGPTAAFTVSPSSGPAPLTVGVSDASTGGPSAWAWDFGDGTGSTLAAPPSHVYPDAGVFTISLLVSNANGSSSTSRAVTVTAGSAPPPSRVASMTFEAQRLIDPTGATKTSGPVTIETATPLAGVASARVTGSTSAYLERSWSAIDDAYVVATIRFSALPTATTRILQISDLGTTVGSLQLQVTGTLRLRNGSTTVGADSAPLAAGVTYRIGIHQRRGTGSTASLEAFLAPVGTDFGAPFAGLASGTWTTAADRLRIGATAGGAIDLTMDDVLVDAAAMPGVGVAASGAGLVASAHPVESTAPVGGAFICTIG
jgi:PKD repeat protein